MRLSALSPLVFAVAMATAGVAAVVDSAHAAPASQRMTDTAYLALARCAGIADGAGSDASAFDKALRDNEDGREPFVADRAAVQRSDAAREARHAGPDTKAHLTAELNGVCKTLAS